MPSRLPYKEVWGGDFEFSAPPGERPDPKCLVARELITRTTRRIWQDELRSLRAPPYPVSEDTLFVAYYASAEVSCHLALGWAVPLHILDLFTEFRTLTNGLHVPYGASLLGALAYFGLDAMDVAKKESMRLLVQRPGPYTVEERLAIQDYCEEDVNAVERLLASMLPLIDLQSVATQE